MTISSSWSIVKDISGTGHRSKLIRTHLKKYFKEKKQEKTNELKQNATRNARGWMDAQNLISNQVKINVLMQVMAFKQDNDNRYVLQVF